MTSRKLAVVTGASSGIGQASALALAAEGFEVICAARRTDRIAALAKQIDGRAITCDVTKPDDIAALAAQTGDRLDVLVNNAGGAFGQEPVADADLEQWRQMYELNVIGTAMVTKALLPALKSGGFDNTGLIIMMGSTAADITYEGAAGYCAAKMGVRAITDAIRLEEYDQPIRICEIAPGMVKTPEFALVRYAGDSDRAQSVYAGVSQPLTEQDIAEAVAWVATRPSHVNIDRMIMRPRAQAAQYKVDRTH